MRIINQIIINSIKRKKKTRKQSKQPLESLPFQFHKLTGKKLVSTKSFWKELQLYIRENEIKNEKLEEKNMLLEAQLSSAQDEFEKIENALLEVSSLYDQLVDRNGNLIRENKQLYTTLKNIPFDVWKKFSTPKSIELSLSSQSDYTINSNLTKKNLRNNIVEE